MRKAAKVDANQAKIIAALRAVGAAVCDLSAVGAGCPDILVSHRQKWHLMEIKNGSKSPSRRQLTPAQVKWHGEHRAHVWIIESVDDALMAIGAMTEAMRRQVLDTYS